MSSNKGYQFLQTDHSLTIQVPVSTQYTKGDIKVESTINTIKVVCKDEVLIKGTLHADIKAAETEWDLQESSPMEFTPEIQLLIIKLEKAEVSPKDKQWPLAIKSSLPGESDADPKSIYFIAKTLIKDEPKKALELLVKSSEMGCIMATLHLAQAYHLGSNGISKQPDMKEAFKWYIKASENGNAMASYFLATSLSLGRHTETNFFEACNFFRRTLEQLGDQIPPPDMVVSWDQNKVPKLTSEDVGAEVKSKLDLYVSSLFQLGGLYLQGGNGLKQDFQQSFKFVEHGSKFNHGPCLYGVGLAYMEGLGVEVNMELATSSFHRAIKLDPSLQLPPNIPRP